MNLIPILTLTVPSILMHPITLVPLISRTDTSKDIFFSPTVTGTLDLVFIESQAAGVAVVGPRAVAVPLVVTDGVNGRRRGEDGKFEKVWKSSRMASFWCTFKQLHFGRMLRHCC